MAIEIRRAMPDDRDTIAKFALLLFAQHRGYDPVRFADLASVEGAAAFYGSRTTDSKAAILLAVSDGEPVGYAYMQYEAVSYTDLMENAALLHDIYLDPAARGLGAGKLLMDAVTQAAREMGADKVVLHVAAQNAVGKDFFERTGFRTSMYEMMLKVEPHGA
jgi:ribosomal protein S18 acetylase RimI-like enzyme